MALWRMCGRGVLSGGEGDRRTYTHGTNPSTASAGLPFPIRRPPERLLRNSQQTSLDEGMPKLQGSY